MGNQRDFRTHQQRYSAGFALLSTLVLVPILLCVLAGGMMVTTALLELRTVTTDCRRLSLSAQLELKTPLKNILSLNSTARTLRQQHMKAKAKLVLAMASGNPSAIAAAKSVLHLINIKRIALAQEQNLILNEASRIKYKFEQKINERLKEVKTKSPGGGLALVARPPADIAPEYLPIEPFQKQQALTIQGHVSLFDSLQKKLGPMGLIPMTRLPYSCGASLKKKGLTWTSILEMAKSS